MKKGTLNTIAILFSTLILLVIGFYNFYPLFTSDSGAYINNAFHFEVPRDRPIFYSLFIFISSLKLSLWLVVFVQSLLMAYLIDKFLTTFFTTFNNYKRILIVGILVCFTSLGWYTVQIMPDVFTPMVCLATLLFLFSKSKKEELIYVAIMLFSIIVHNSNLITSTLFFVPILIVKFLFKIEQISYLKLIKVTLVIITSWIVICLTNLFAGNGFTPSKSSHIFLMGKLVENGILKKYLDENCNQKTYKLCQFKNDLPPHAWDFIWNNEGTFAKTGGWDSSKTEYSEIIHATLSQPKYIQLNAIESFKATIKQFQLTDVGDGLCPYLDGSNPFWKVQESFHLEMNMYLASKQNTNKLHFNIINTIIQYFFIITTILSLLILIKTKDKNYLILLLLITSFTFINAFTTATFANVLARLNSRAIWLIPFINISIILNFLYNYLTIKNSKK